MPSIALFSLILLFSEQVVQTQCVHKLSKRFLIFPQSAPTRHQFIAGIGIPADLEEESLTVGYVLKSQYYLPYNETTFRQNPIFPEYRRTRDLHQTEVTRLQVYEAIEQYLDNMGYNGVECLLRFICESASIPIEEEFSIFDDLLRILVTPSLIPEESKRGLEIYLAAEEFGLSGQSCQKEYMYCPQSFLNVISIALRNSE